MNSDGEKSIEFILKQIHDTESDRNRCAKAFRIQNRVAGLTFFVLCLIVVMEVLCATFGWRKPLDGFLGWMLGTIGAAFVLFFVGGTVWGLIENCAEARRWERERKRRKSVRADAGEASTAFPRNES
jgi:p-aminobenzoyl-glutamate transporter AbgT